MIFYMRCFLIFLLKIQELKFIYSKINALIYCDIASNIFIGH